MNKWSIFKDWIILCVFALLFGFVIGSKHECNSREHDRLETESELLRLIMAIHPEYIVAKEK